MQGDAASVTQSEQLRQQKLMATSSRQREKEIRAANERRMQIQQQLLDEAMRVLARKREIPLVPTEEGSGLVHHQLWEGHGTALNICELKVPDVMPEQFIDFFRNRMEILPTYHKKVQIKAIDKDGDFQIVHQRFEMPFMINNRSMFNTYYLIDGSEPGEF